MSELAKQIVTEARHAAKELRDSRIHCVTSDVLAAELILASRNLVTPGVDLETIETHLRSLVFETHAGHHEGGSHNPKSEHPGHALGD